GTPLARKTEWVPVTPTATNNVTGGANLDNVPTVFAGRWGDTATALDPAVFRGRVAVFLASAQAAGLSGRGGQRVLRCDSVPNKFGADAAARVEAQARADSAAGRGRGAGGRGGRGGGGGRDARPQAIGAAGVLLIAIDSAARTNA